MMWVSPSHPDPPRPATPPTDEGLRLLTCPRPNGQEIRLSIYRFEGRSTLRAQLWQENERGQLWPIKGRSVSWRADEMPALIRALREAEHILQGSQAGPPDDTRPRFVDRRRHKPKHYDPDEIARVPRGADRDFNEFEGGR